MGKNKFLKVHHGVIWKGARVFFFLFTSVFFPGFIFCQADTIELPFISITASRISVESRRLNQSVTTLSEEILVKGQPRVSLQDYAAYVPGVLAQNAENYAQDVRISIRGFGSRSAFGIRGIRILVDGLPETTPDGQANIDNIDPGFLQSMEIIRGVSTVLYGNAAGGVLALYSRDPNASFSFNSGYLTGSNGLRKLDVWMGGKSPKRSWSLFGSTFSHVGYREWSQTKTNLLNGKYEVNLRKGKLKFLANWASSPLANDPGALTAAEVNLSRRSAFSRNIQFKAGEELIQYRVGNTWDQDLKNNKRIQAYSFYSKRIFDNRLPFEAGGYVRFARQFWGGGLSLQQLKTHFQWILGFEASSQEDERQRFANKSGIKGALNLNQNELFRGGGVYGQYRYFPTPKWEFIAAARVDKMHLGVEDLFLTDGNQGGSMDYLRLNPSAGFVFKPNRHSGFFGDWSRHFETPALTELSANPNNTGGFNPDLKPQSSSQYALGYRFEPQKWLKSDFSIYQIDLRDEWISYGLAAFPGRTFYRNAGISRRMGFEVFTHFFPEGKLGFISSATFARHYFRDYPSGNQNFMGNRVPGFSPFQFFTEFRAQVHPSVFISGNGRWQGKQFANDTNSVVVPPYFLLGARFQILLPAKWVNMEILGGVNNALNTAFYSNVRINAAANRFFEPASVRTFYIGLRMHFNSRGGEGK
jgi:iron complex outermembrane receptor protein